MPQASRPIAPRTTLPPAAFGRYAFGLVAGFGEGGWLPGEALAPGAAESPAGLRYLASLYRALGFIVGVGDWTMPATAAQCVFHLLLMAASLVCRLPPPAPLAPRRLGPILPSGSTRPLHHS